MSTPLPRQPERLSHAGPRGTPRPRTALQGHLWRAHWSVSPARSSSPTARGRDWIFARG
ncbi:MULTISPECIES: hypothetical protein [Paracoccus]|uniref:hypothetical protein n=1 Tax=Paracoccus TaxID=265 RepID=UPI00140C4D34|nr:MULTISPECIES: hypothetical protein [Paracoccus]